MRVLISASVIQTGTSSYTRIVARAVAARGNDVTVAAVERTHQPIEATEGPACTDGRTGNGAASC